MVRREVQAGAKTTVVGGPDPQRRRKPPDLWDLLQRHLPAEKLGPQGGRAPAGKWSSAPKVPVSRRSSAAACTASHRSPSRTSVDQASSWPARMASVDACPVVGRLPHLARQLGNRRDLGDDLGTHPGAGEWCLRRGATPPVAAQAWSTAIAGHRPPAAGRLRPHRGHQGRQPGPRDGAGQAALKERASPPDSFSGGLLSAGYGRSSGRTLAAWGPLGPDVTSNSTACPSSSER